MVAIVVVVAKSPPAVRMIPEDESRSSGDMRARRTSVSPVLSGQNTHVITPKGDIDRTARRPNVNA